MRSIVPACFNKATIAGIPLAAAVVLALSGCGGGGDTAAVAAGGSVTGKFVDATVVGLGYKCGASTALTGTTDASGQFTCKTGEAVAFYVGGIKLGSVASAQALVTPLDLAGTGATPSSTTVNNIVRFLMSISSTAASGGTLTIDSAVAAAAAARSIDFTSVLAADLDTVINAVKPAGATVATVLQAKDHMSSSVFGLFAGSYSGAYSGSLNGNWTISIDKAGKVSGTATDSSGASAVTGTMATTVGTGSTYAFTGSAGGEPWTGTLNLLTREFKGTWSGGTFTGKGS